MNKNIQNFTKILNHKVKNFIKNKDENKTNLYSRTHNICTISTHDYLNLILKLKDINDNTN